MSASAVYELTYPTALRRRFCGSILRSIVRDLYGTINVGAIHGALLTAWSVAGVVGPVLVNYIREYQITHGVAKADVYSITMYVMTALLLVGLACNLAIRPVHERHYLEAQATAS